MQQLLFFFFHFLYFFKYEHVLKIVVINTLLEKK